MCVCVCEHSMVNIDFYDLWLKAERTCIIIIIIIIWIIDIIIGI